MSTLGSDIYSGTAMFGKFVAVLGAVGTSLMALILMYIGISALRDKHTHQVTATISSFDNPCMMDIKTGFYTCYAHIAYYVAKDGQATKMEANNVQLIAKVPLKAGDQIILYYDPSNPADIKQELFPRKTGWWLIGSGLVIGGVGVGLAWLTFYSKGFAAITGGASILKAVF